MKEWLLVAMYALGVGAMALTAWLFEWHEGRSIEGAVAAEPRGSAPLRTPLDALAAGLSGTLNVAARDLGAGRRSEAARALDAALRAAEVGAAADRGGMLGVTLARVRAARRALHNGRPRKARRHVDEARRTLRGKTPGKAGTAKALGGYAGATVINANGVRIGKVERVEADKLRIVFGPGLDVLGILDLRSEPALTVPARFVLFGPNEFFGPTLVALPVSEDTRVLVDRRAAPPRPRLAPARALQLRRIGSALELQAASRVPHGAAAAATCVGGCRRGRSVPPRLTGVNRLH